MLISRIQNFRLKWGGLFFFSTMSGSNSINHFDNRAKICHRMDSSHRESQFERVLRFRFSASSSPKWIAPLTNGAPAAPGRIGGGIAHWSRIKWVIRLSLAGYDVSLYQLSPGPPPMAGWVFLRCRISTAVAASRAMDHSA